MLVSTLYGDTLIVDGIVVVAAVAAAHFRPLYFLIIVKLCVLYRLIISVHHDITVE